MIAFPERSCQPPPPDRRDGLPHEPLEHPTIEIGETLEGQAGLAPPVVARCHLQRRLLVDRPTPGRRPNHCRGRQTPASAVVAFGFLPIPYPAMGRWQQPPDDDDDESDDAWDDDSPSGDDSDDGDEPTVPCPYCGHEILEDAPRCPACERYLSLEDSPAPRKPLWVIVTALVCLAAVIWWIVAA